MNSELGINTATATNRLVKDLLFAFAIKAGHKCHRCGLELTRDTFSIEHKTPWRGSDDPNGLFFDIGNIAYSHLGCNVGAARRYKKPCGTQAAYKRGCRCEECRAANAAHERKYYTPERRRVKYQRTGE